ncbi:MAG: hypothetical protein ACYCVY_01150 [Acidiferrobacteraceae bacterium]
MLKLPLSPAARRSSNTRGARPGVFQGTIRDRLLELCVVTAGSDFPFTAHDLDAELFAMCVDEWVPESNSATICLGGQGRLSRDTEISIATLR